MSSRYVLNLQIRIFRTFAFTEYFFVALGHSCDYVDSHSSQTRIYEFFGIIVGCMSFW